MVRGIAHVREIAKVTKVRGIMKAREIAILLSTFSGNGNLYHEE